MTRKHFELIASALLSARPAGANLHAPASLRLKQAGEIAGWLEACRAMCHACSRINPRFDRARFLDACGYYTPQGGPEAS